MIIMMIKDVWASGKPLVLVYGFLDKWNDDNNNINDDGDDITDSSKDDYDADNSNSDSINLL